MSVWGKIPYLKRCPSKQYISFDAPTVDKELGTRLKGDGLR
jgi:hypothetical protein